jgi:hypothetical protein
MNYQEYDVALLNELFLTLFVRIECKYTKKGQYLEKL